MERQVYVFTCSVCSRPHIAYVRIVEMSCCKKWIKTFRVAGLKEAQKLERDWERKQKPKRGKSK